MGRPKCYASPAARQAAYRQRLDADMVLVNREALMRVEDQVTRLVDAMTQAAHRGNPLALQLRRAQRGTIVESLIDWFTTWGELDAQPFAAPARFALGLGDMAAPTGGQERAVPLSVNPGEYGEIDE